jgi:hypothetical protein
MRLLIVEDDDDLGAGLSAGPLKLDPRIVRTVRGVGCVLGSPERSP